MLVIVCEAKEILSYLSDRQNLNMMPHKIIHRTSEYSLRSLQACLTHAFCSGNFPNHKPLPPGLAHTHREGSGAEWTGAWGLRAGQPRLGAAPSLPPGCEPKLWSFSIEGGATALRITLRMRHYPCLSLSTVHECQPVFPALPLYPEGPSLYIRPVLCHMSPNLREVLLPPLWIIPRTQTHVISNTSSPSSDWKLPEGKSGHSSAQQALETPLTD